MRVAVIGAGWAGLAAAVAATQAGHHATVFEASRTLGGRARVVQGLLPDGCDVALDNGQHILIGAYSETLRLMELVDADPTNALLRLPLTLRFHDGSGVEFPRWPSPFDAAAGIARARGWSLLDKLSLLKSSASWQMRGFTCDRNVTVTQLCSSLRPKIMAELIEPLCVSALNTPAVRASGQVFLRVLRDSLFGAAGSSNLLLPKVDLTSLFPAPAARWLETRGARLKMASRVDQLIATAHPGGWHIDGEAFDHVILATSASHASALVDASVQLGNGSSTLAMRAWADAARALQFEAISTVYAFATGARLSQPMLTLRGQPAQFVFDRGQLGGPAGLMAFVVSASAGDRGTLEGAVVAQARSQLNLAVQPIQTIVEKRATFACTPDLLRPTPFIAPGLVACGDYCEGPYPATLEGAVRSAIAAVKLLRAP